MYRYEKNSLKRNIFHLFYSTILSRAINALILLLLANYLDSEKYGVFSVVLAIAMVMGFLTDIGLNNTVLREGSKNSADIPSIFSTYLKYKVILLIVTLLITYLVVYTFYPKREIILIGNFLMIPMIFGNAIQNFSTTYFQLVERMHQVGLIRIVTAILQIILVLLAMLFSLSFYLIAFSFGLSYLLGGVYSLFLLKKELRLSRSYTIQRNLLKGLGSFIISGLIILLLPQLGPLLLDKTVLYYELGFFSVAYRIPSALYQIPGIMAGAFYPILFKYYNSNQLLEHLKFNILEMKVMSIVGMFITIPIYHMSFPLIELLFGQKWMPVAIPLKILSTLLIFQSISFPLADGLTSKGLQNRRTVIQIFAAILGIVLYYFLSLKFRILGAAYAAIVIEIFSILGLWAMNPSRFIIAKKFLFPYSLFFIGTLAGVDFFLSKYSILATLINISLLFLVLLVDKELRVTVERLIKDTIILTKFKKSVEYGRRNS
jgi:O-antigen/teichoic acid export membrane protein